MFVAKKRDAGRPPVAATMAKVASMVVACGVLAVFVSAEARPGVCYLDPGAALAVPVLAIDQAGAPTTRAADEAGDSPRHPPARRGGARDEC